MHAQVTASLPSLQCTLVANRLEPLQDKTHQRHRSVQDESAETREEETAAGESMSHTFCDDNEKKMSEEDQQSAAGATASNNRCVTSPLSAVKQSRTSAAGSRNMQCVHLLEQKQHPIHS